MRFKTRKAKISDLDLIDELYVINCLDDIPPTFRKKKKSERLKEFKDAEKGRRKFFKEELQKANQIWLIAHIDNEVIGFVQGVIEKSYGGKMGLIDKIYLNKKFRGKDIGTKLGKLLMKEMKKRNVNFYEARLYSNNIASKKLNEKLGLKPFSLRMRKKA
jgi:RimJ/RimL family protein N-acetyltransferase